MERRWSVDGRRKSEARQGGGWSRSWVLGERVDLDEHARAWLTGDPWLGRGRWLVGLDPSSRERCPAWGASSERSLMGFRIVLEFHSSSWRFG